MFRVTSVAVFLVSILAIGCAGSSPDAVLTPTAPAATSSAIASPTSAATARPTPAATASPTVPATASPPVAATASATPPPTTSPTPAATASATPLPTATATRTSTPTPGGQPAVEDTRATRLAIPSLGIDSTVSGSQVIPDTAPSPPGCPPKPAGQETLTVPNHGIATPDVAFEGLENKSWIYGHSRWQNVPGVLFVLQDVAIGDELFVHGFDRQTGDAVTNRRFVVEGIYLTDTDSGGELVTADSPAEIPTAPLVILQTSARESGANKQWLLDRQKVVAKATNLVEGDVDDICKYLLLFVIARAS